MELLAVLLIIAITATLTLPPITRVEGVMRANRAARELVAALRFARSLSLTTGATYGVQTDTVNNKFWVYNSTAPTTPIAQALRPGGTYLVTLAANSEIAGTTMTVTPPGTGGLTLFPFNPLGTCTNGSATANVVFTYSDHKCTVSIPAVGDPAIN
jgi:Tfp pilus assembly protein FimT